MGHTHNDPKPREFMAEIAAIAGGVFRCMDPFTPLNQEFGGDSYNDNLNFNDDEFVQFFQGRLKDVLQQLLQNVGLYPPQQYSSSANNLYQNPSPNFKSQLKSRPRLQDEIHIPSFHHEHGHYRFDIRQIIPEKDGQWSISHTFDEFKQLHHQLQKRCALPTFPLNHYSRYYILVKKIKNNKDKFMLVHMNILNLIYSY
jgi:hypothetical protein